MMDVKIPVIMLHVILFIQRAHKHLPYSRGFKCDELVSPLQMNYLPGYPSALKGQYTDMCE
jgi:hypothetical protein